MISLRRPTRRIANHSATGRSVSVTATPGIPSRPSRWRGYLLANVAGPRGLAPAHVLEVDSRSALITSVHPLAAGELVEMRLPMGASYARRHGVAAGEVRIRGVVSRPQQQGRVEIYEIVFATTPLEFDADDYAAVHGMRRPAALPALAG